MKARYDFIQPLYTGSLNGTPDLIKFTNVDENAGGPSSTRPHWQTSPIGLTEFGPPKPYFQEKGDLNQGGQVNVMDLQLLDDLIFGATVAPQLFTSKEAFSDQPPLGLPLARSWR